MDYSMPPALRRSESLHKRVVEYARSFDGKRTALSETFESLALDLARFQLEHSPGLQRLCGVDAKQLKHLDQIPIVPSDVFRLTRVALHPEELDVSVFQTSGTTAALTGRHPVRQLGTKEELALIQAQKTLFSEYGRGVVVALSPPPDGKSSLVHMMQLFMRHFDGRPLLASPDGAAFSMSEPGRFLVSTHGVDVEGLKRAARLAKHRAEPLYLLTTSFALLAALDALDGETVSAPQRTKIMLTGGFKGRTRSIDESELRALAAECFGIPRNQIVGEYGMTELSSQLFEHPAPETTNKNQRAQDSAWFRRYGSEGDYFAPPWLRVSAVNPCSYKEVPEGEVGLAHFLDLANVDSCLSVLTQDLIQVQAGRVRLVGRAPRAPMRGCSLPFEALAVSSGASSL